MDIQQLGNGELGNRLQDLRPGILMSKKGSSGGLFGQSGKRAVGMLRREAGFPVLVDELDK